MQQLVEEEEVVLLQHVDVGHVSFGTRKEMSTCRSIIDIEEYDDIVRFIHHIRMPHMSCNSTKRAHLLFFIIIIMYYTHQHLHVHMLVHVYYAYAISSLLHVLVSHHIFTSHVHHFTSSSVSVCSSSSSS